jgi:hypothetical protein
MVQGGAVVGREKLGLPEGRKLELGRLRKKEGRVLYGWAGWSRSWSREYNTGCKVRSVIRASRRIARCRLKCSRNTERFTS